MAFASSEPLPARKQSWAESNADAIRVGVFTERSCGINTIRPFVPQIRIVMARPAPPERDLRRLDRIPRTTTVPGGCFLTTASVEFDARPGPVNGAVKNALRTWTRVLEREARTAIDNAQRPRETDPEDIAFTVNALAVGANCDYQLPRDPRGLKRARRAMTAVLSPRSAPP